MRAGLILSFFIMVAVGALSQTSRAADRHADYYYPKPVTTETYKARASTLPEANRRRRIGFVTHVTNSMMQNNPYPAGYAIFAKGSNAQKMIIVGLGEQRYNTLYRMRGLLANLTAVARVSPMFKDAHMEDFYTFLDLLKMMGFKQVTVTDGKSFAHQIKVE
jgi:hypothetical protein